MIQVIFLIIICLFLALLEIKGFNYGLKICFILIFIFSAIRYDYGNDFQSYLQSYESIKGIDFNILVEMDSHWEPGWLILYFVFSFFFLNFQFIIIFVLRCYC